MAATNGEEAGIEPQQQSDDLAKRVPPGTVLPPRHVRETIEKVAAYIARNGIAFEDKLRSNPSSKTTFIEPEDAYNAYYKWRVDEIKAGRGFDDDSQNIARKTDVTFAGKNKAPLPPPEYQFSARMPNISAQDLEIVKLTALYVAKNGRSWMTQLSQREAGNYQFDFLRPQHSLNMFFTRMVEQYKDLIEGETADDGAPQKKRIAELEKSENNHFHVLVRAKRRAEYQQWQQKQKVQKEAEEENDRVLFAQIDWHDFAVVATIAFDERDEHADMPPPRTLNDMLSLSLEEKARMRIDPNRRLEEAVPTFDEYEDIYGQQPQMPAAQMPPPSGSAMPSPSMLAPNPTVLEERERIRLAAKAQQQGRAKNDYVPRAQRNMVAQNTSLCSICKQAIPNDEYEQHLKIEMLSPEWREQMAKNQQRSSTTNLSTTDVANNLKRLASQRTDVFDPVTGQALAQEEQGRRKRVELQGYDGPPLPHVASGMMSTSGTEQYDVQDQIRVLHERFKK